MDGYKFTFGHVSGASADTIPSEGSYI